MSQTAGYTCHDQRIQLWLWKVFFGDETYKIFHPNNNVRWTFVQFVFHLDWERNAFTNKVYINHLLRWCDRPLFCFWTKITFELQMIFNYTCAFCSRKLCRAGKCRTTQFEYNIDIFSCTIFLVSTLLSEAGVASGSNLPTSRGCQHRKVPT